MLKSITDILDSEFFQIVFAIWTGVYLVQVIKGESGAPSTNELGWIILAAAFAVFLV